jgi:diguanylate cyclase (GGDEF)-like protein
MSLQQAFTMLLSAGCLVAAITHVAFGYLFWQHGISAMAWVNVASVLVYALSALMLRRGRTAPAIILMLSEVTAHALAAVIAVGWESGFHYYLLVVIPIFLANQVVRWPVRIGVGLAVSSAYMLLDMRWHHRPAIWPMPPEVLSSLHTFNLGSTIAILCVFTVLYVHLISQAEARLHELATTDSLTGLMNRRSMGAALQRLQTLRQRKPQPVTMMLVDIDHFKRLNDSHGHAAGDWALQAVADVLEIGVRDVDLLARWGGEEFLIALPDADLNAAAQVAERLRQNIAALRFPLGPGSKGGDVTEQQVTATFGLAPLAPDEPAEAAIHRADVALYQGKQGGRNRVVKGH